MFAVPYLRTLVAPLCFLDCGLSSGTGGPMMPPGRFRMNSSQQTDLWHLPCARNHEPWCLPAGL